jgi:hypothetical protein
MLVCAAALAAGCSRPAGRAQDAAQRPSAGDYVADCDLPNDDPRCVGRFDLPPDMVEAAKHPIAPAPIITEGNCRFKANVLMLFFKPGTTRAQLDEIARSERGRVHSVSWGIELATLELPTTTGEALRAAGRRLKAHAQVEGFDLNMRCGRHDHEARHRGKQRDGGRATRH